MINQISTTYFIQGVSALIIGLVILNYFRLYHRDYLRFWAYSFIGLTVFLTSSVILLLLNKAGFEYTTFGMFTISLIKSNAGYLQIYWLLLGTFLLFRPESKILRRNKAIITIVMLAASVMASLYAFDSDGGLLRNTLRSGFRYAIGGVAFIVAAISLFSFQTRSSLGKKLVGWAFLFYGAELSFLGFLNIRTLFGYGWETLIQLVVVHGIFELLIYPVIGLGLVIWLLENERFKSQIIYEKLATLSHSDPLTGLANRQGFEKILASWRRSQHSTHEKLLIVLFGIDQFKRINQAGGVRQGDEVLVAFANRLTHELSGIADKARISGDVFAMALTGNMANAENLKWLRKRFSRPIQLNQQKVHIEVSVGAAWMDIDDTSDGALIGAQRALHQAKLKGGKQSLMFDNTMPEQTDTLALENELRNALGSSEFALYLQPIYNADNLKISGFEVLTRWLHPTRGLLAPVEFLPHLAELNLMPEFDRHVLKTSVDLILNWSEQGIKDPFLAVNLSAEGLQDDKYLKHAHEELARIGDDSNRLHIEITENSAMKSIDSGLFSLDKLQAMGVQISVDDFGTGYSSLNYLKSFPAHKIKFDRSFINEMVESTVSRTILQSLVPLCQELNKLVVAEGIETKQQMQMARAIGFDQFQGYYFAKPMSVQEAVQLFLEQPKPSNGKSSVIYRQNNLNS